MGGRSINALVVVCWIASMTWLTTTKILPLLLPGEHPDYAPAATVEPEEVCWRIVWDDTMIGWAATEQVRRDELIHVHNVVQVNDVPLDRVIRQAFGPLGEMLQRQLLGDEALSVTLHLDSHAELTDDGDLRSFRTNVDLGDTPGLMQLHGAVRDGRLDLTVFGGGPLARDDGQTLHRTQVDLPDGSLLGDAAAPQPELSNLRVGQRWTFKLIRPFPPTEPLQLVEARVDREEFIIWDGQLVGTLVVEYRDQAGSGVTATREPFGRLWVGDDGMVLQQEISLAGLRMLFLRMPRASCEGKLP